MPITNKDRAGIRHIYKKIVTEHGPSLAAHYAQAKPGEPVVNPVVVIAEQVLFRCLEVVLHESMPFDLYLLPELAARMAAYIISAAPVEEHEGMVKEVNAAIGPALAGKVAKGFVVQTGWNSGGIVHPNIMTRQ